MSLHRVLDQHKLSRDQWEERIQVWHEEHRGMLKYVYIHSEYMNSDSCVCLRCNWLWDMLNRTYKITQVHKYRAPKATKKDFQWPTPLLIKMEAIQFWCIVTQFLHNNIYVRHNWRWAIKFLEDNAHPDVIMQLLLLCLLLPLIYAFVFSSGQSNTAVVTISCCP